MQRCRLAVFLVIATCVQAQTPDPKWDTSNWNKTRSIKELPFCVFVLREYHDKFDAAHEVHVLMEPDEVTENNLRLLFGAISGKDPESPIMRVQVETDVERLAMLANRGVR